MSEKISMMAAFAERLYARMAEDPRIRVMTADLVGSCALKKIEADHPNQFINVGIAEQNMGSPRPSGTASGGSARAPAAQGV